MPRVHGRAASAASDAKGLRPTDVVGSFDGPVGAYVHVPFCEWICPFCPYNKVRAEETLARRYFAALCKEVDRYVAEHDATHGTPFTSLYVGGGTPTLYPEALADLVPRVPVSGERAIEVLPTHGTPARLNQLAETGFTAVSIGAQSFNDGVLQRLHRPHDAAASLGAVENALGRFACVDVDLIVDVAWEDEGAFPGAFLADVGTCFSLGVDQVSTYPLMRFGYTPFGTASHDRRREHAVLAQVSELARSMGYERRSVWTFNRQGAPAYTSITRRRFLGMGAGSSSFAGRDFYVNHFGVNAYCDAVEQGRLPVARWLHLGPWAGAAYDAFWQAYSGRIDPTALGRSFGRPVAGCARTGLASLALAGLLRSAPDGYHLTARGYGAYHDLERLVTYQLIEPLWAEMLTEQRTAPGTGGACADWVVPASARSSRTWATVRRLFERPSRDQGKAG